MKKSYAGIIFIIFTVSMLIIMILMKQEIFNITNVKSRLRSAAYNGAIAGAQVTNIEEFETTGVIELDLSGTYTALNVAERTAREQLRSTLQNYDADTEVEIETEAKNLGGKPYYVEVTCRLSYKPYFKAGIFEGAVLEEKWTGEPNKIQ